jgi:hypothetical protein
MWDWLKDRGKDLSKAVGKGVVEGTVDWASDQGRTIVDNAPTGLKARLGALFGSSAAGDYVRQYPWVMLLILGGVVFFLVRR